MKKIPIILDVDTGIDDAMALLMACANDRLDILGVTATYGNTVLENTLKNTMNVLKLAGRTDIPVAAGTTKPIYKNLSEVEKMHNGKFVHGTDGLGSYKFPFEDYSDSLVSKPAWDFMYDLIMQSEEPVVLCPLGPLTTVAMLLQKYPDVKSNIKCIVNMGGYIRGGIISPMASVNLFFDVIAAKQVLASGVDFYMIPGDTTDRAIISLEEMAEFNNSKSEPCKAVDHFLSAYYKTCAELGEEVIDGINGQSLHDPCSIAFITHPEFFTYGKYFVDMEEQSEVCYGMTVVDYQNTLGKSDDDKNVYYVDTVKREAFVKYFTDSIKSYETKEAK